MNNIVTFSGGSIDLDKQDVPDVPGMTSERVRELLNGSMVGREVLFANPYRDNRGRFASKGGDLGLSNLGQPPKGARGKDIDKLPAQAKAHVDAVASILGATTPSQLGERVADAATGGSLVGGLSGGIGGSIAGGMKGYEIGSEHAGGIGGVIGAVKGSEWGGEAGGLLGSLGGSLIGAGIGAVGHLYDRAKMLVSPRLRQEDAMNNSGRNAWAATRYLKDQKSTNKEAHRMASQAQSEAATLTREYAKNEPDPIRKEVLTNMAKGHENMAKEHAKKAK